MKSLPARPEVLKAEFVGEGPYTEVRRARPNALQVGLAFVIVFGNAAIVGRLLLHWAGVI